MAKRLKIDELDAVVENQSREEVALSHRIAILPYMEMFIEKLIDKPHKEKYREIFCLYLQGYHLQEIANVCGYTKSEAVRERLKTVLSLFSRIQAPNNEYVETLEAEVADLKVRYDTMASSYISTLGIDPEDEAFFKRYNGISLHNSDASVRLINFCHSIGIDTVYQLSQMKHIELFRFRGFGPRVYGDAKEFLTSLGVESCPFLNNDENRMKK